MQTSTRGQLEFYSACEACGSALFLLRPVGGAGAKIGWATAQWWAAVRTRGTDGKVRCRPCRRRVFVVGACFSALVADALGGAA